MRRNTMSPERKLYTTACLFRQKYVLVSVVTCCLPVVTFEPRIRPLGHNTPSNVLQQTHFFLFVIMTTWEAACAKATKMVMGRKPAPALDPVVGNALDEALHLTPVTVDHRQVVHDRPMVADWLLLDAGVPPQDLHVHVEQMTLLILERVRDSTVVQCALRDRVLLTTFHFQKRYTGPIPFCKGSPHIVKFSSGRGVDLDKKAFQLVLEEWGQSRYTGYAVTADEGGLGPAQTVAGRGGR